MKDREVVTRLTLPRPWRRTWAVGSPLAFAACLLAVVPGEAAAQSSRQVASAGVAYFEEDDAAVTWSGSWSSNPRPANHGGAARLAMDVGARATFGFAGTGVSWIGYRDEWCGIARVFVDGVVQATVDTYSTPAQAQATLYTITGLEGGAHIFAIEATGTHSEVSGGSWIWVDAFAVPEGSTPAPAPQVLAPRSSPRPERAGRAGRAGRNPGQPDRVERGARLELDDPAVTWSGAWSSNQLKVHSRGVARLSMEASSRVDVVFTGAGVTWIGYRDEWSGIADVLLDGRLRASVDTYSPAARAQVALYTIEGLPDGPHTLTIQPTGRHRPVSGGSWVWVDTFSITR